MEIIRNCFSRVNVIRVGWSKHVVQKNKPQKLGSFWKDVKNQTKHSKIQRTFDFSRERSSPRTSFEKTGGGQKYTAAKYVSPKLGPDDNK